MTTSDIYLTIDQAGADAVTLLHEQTGMSRHAIKQAMHEGADWLTTQHGTRRIRRAGKALKAGNKLHSYWDTAVLTQPPAAAMTLDTPIDGKNARSRVRRRWYDSDRDIRTLDIDSKAGRKHQIRRHLDESGFAIVGDRLYRNTRRADTDDVCLACCRLAFTRPLHGTAKGYTLTAKLLPCQSLLRD